MTKRQCGGQSDLSDKKGARTQPYGLTRSKSIYFRTAGTLHTLLLSSYIIQYCIVLSGGLKYINQAISPILLHHNFMLYFEVLHNQTIYSLFFTIVHPRNTATETTTSFGWRKTEPPQLLHSVAATTRTL